LAGIKKYKNVKKVIEGAIEKKGEKEDCNLLKSLTVKGGNWTLSASPEPLWHRACNMGYRNTRTVAQGCPSQGRWSGGG
jgi:hypothetical protein